jgi:HK97 family phage prohead protease
MDEEKKIFKFFGAELKDISTKDYSVTVLVSTKSIDRDKEIVEPEAFRKRMKRYKSNPVLLSSHNHYDLGAVIGKAEKLNITDKGLEARFKYFVGEGNPDADWAFKLIEKGIAAWSIGFIPHGYKEGNPEKDGFIRKYDDVELLEISQVTVPSNPDAVLSMIDEYSGKQNDEGTKTQLEMCEMVAKSFGMKKKTDPEELIGEDIKDPNEDEEIVLEFFKQRIESIEKQYQELLKIQNEIKKFLTEEIDNKLLNFKKSFLEELKMDVCDYSKLLFEPKPRKQAESQHAIQKADVSKALSEAIANQFKQNTK